MSADQGTAERVRRPLRCGEPAVHDVTTADGVTLRLSRFTGGAKGPVMLSPGYGTSHLAYTLDTTDTNVVEYLVEHGYDVWLLDTRWSPLLPSASTQFTLDAVASYDYPAAVAKVRDVTGAETIQLLGHCMGSLAMLMALSLGLPGVRSAVASQVSLHLISGALNEFRSELRLADLITLFGVDTLTTEVDDDPSVAERIYDRLLAFYPEGEEPCDSPFCRRVSFMYGEVYDHDNLNEATHEHLHEAFGVSNMLAFRHITKIMREERTLSYDGSYDYLDGLAGLKLPIAFVHGERNRMFVPEGSRLTYEYLTERNGPGLYTRHVIPGYSHMDCFVGSDAARDVYPLLTAELDRHNEGAP